MTIPAFPRGSQIKLPITFTDSTGNPVDPATMEIHVENPAGVITIQLYPGTVVRDSAGQFHGLIGPPLTLTSGSWSYIGESTDPLIVARSLDIEFTVNWSVFP